MDPSAIIPKDECLSFFKLLKQLAGNKNCVDCNAPNPSWASIPFGAFICFTCAGRHRSLGTHITFVRSTEIDDWTNKQLMIMARGGNANLTNYFRQHNLVASSDKLGRYSHRAGVKYREKMAKLAMSELRQGADFILESNKGAVADEDFFQAVSSGNSGGSLGSFSDASSGTLSPPVMPMSPRAGVTDEAKSALLAGNVSLASVSQGGAPSTFTSDFGQRKPKKKGGLGTRVAEDAFSNMEESMAAQREQDRLDTERCLAQRGRADTEEANAEIFRQSQPSPGRQTKDTQRSGKGDSLADAFGGLGIKQSMPSVGHSASASIQVMSEDKTEAGRTRGGYSTGYDAASKDRSYRDHGSWESKPNARDDGWGSSSKSSSRYDNDGYGHGDEGVKHDSESDLWGFKPKDSHAAANSDWGAPGGDDGGWGKPKAADDDGGWGGSRADQKEPSGWGAVEKKTTEDGGWGSRPNAQSTAKRNEGGGGWGKSTSRSSSVSSGNYNNDRYNDKSRSSSNQGSTGDMDERLKTFANAKSLSSDQYFDREPPSRPRRDAADETSEAIRQAATQFGSTLKKFYYDFQDKYSG